METMRVAYWNEDGEPSEAIVQGENADEAIAQCPGTGHSVTAVGPEAQEPPTDGEVNPILDPDTEDDLTLEETRKRLDLPAPDPNEAGTDEEPDPS